MKIIESDIRGSIEPFTMKTTGSDSRRYTKKKHKNLK
jgi:hypothetical protein